MKSNLLLTILMAGSLLACKQSDSTDDTSSDDTDSDIVDDGLIWPEDEWTMGAPADHQMDADALEALREYAFTDGFQTQSVVVIRDGALIAEWYADGTDADTLVTTWSGAKSVLSALVGVGIRDGVLSLDDTVGSHISAWSEGENQNITVRHMLEMRSGLAEKNAGGYGIYGVEPDQLAHSLDRTPVREPGLSFSYVNEDSMVLGEVVAQAFDESFIDVANREMFEPIGLQGEWWVDGAGHALTYCCIDTTARDFARFGLLFSRDGAWRGNQIVPADYVTESTTGVSYNGYYGLHWWTYGDVFAALGYHNQLLYVYPEKDLVVARFGRYTRYGSEAVRTGTNFHQTSAPGAFDPSRFYDLFMAALVD